MTLIDQSPLFVCGFPSGGTDLTKNILNAHPDIEISGEMPFIYFLYKYGYSCDSTFKTTEEIEDFRALLKKLDRWNNLKNIDKINDQYPINIQHILHNWFTVGSEKIWGNKTPQNSENIEHLLTIFPKGKFLVIIRDIRDVVLSWKRKWGKDYLLCAHKWQNRMAKTYITLQQLSKDQYLILRYEDLITDLEQHTKEICNFLNVEWSVNMLDYQLYVQDHIEGKINYGQKIITSNFNKWKNKLNKRNIQRIEEIAFNTLNLFDYEIELAKKQVPIMWYEKKIGLINDVKAVLWHGNKFSSNNSLSKRIKTLAGELRQSILKTK